jgi:hypothetical protein
MVYPGVVGGGVEAVAQAPDRNPPDAGAAQVGVRADEHADLKENPGGSGHDSAERLATNEQWDHPAGRDGVWGPRSQDVMGAVLSGGTAEGLGLAAGVDARG